MMDRIKKYLDPIKTFWQNAAKKTKMLVVSGVGVTIAAALIIIIILNTGNYVQVAASLSANEAANIMARLESLGINGKTESGAVYVPKDRKDEVILDLAINPVSESGLTLDIFNEGKDLTMTDSQRKEISTYQKQARIEAVLEKIENIQSVNVTINEPENSSYVFKADKKERTVAVVVHMKPGRKLSIEAVAGINSIVCSAAGVESKDVSIIDGNGINLKSTLDENGSLSGDADSRKLALKVQVEENLQYKLSNLLSFLGEGNYRIVVDAVVNTDNELTEISDYKPEPGTNTGVVGNQQTEEEFSAEGGIGYAPGTDPDTDEYQVEVEGDNLSGYYRNNDISYMVDHEKKVIEKEGYTLEGISASIVINRASQSLVPDGEAISTEVMEDIRELIGSGGGIPLENIKVSPVTFGDIVEETVVPGSMITYLIIIIVAIIILIVAIMVVIMVRKKRLAAAEAEMPEESASSVFQVNIPDEIDLPPIAGNETLEQKLKSEIIDFAKTDPSIVASLIKGWLMEDDE